MNYPVSWDELVESVFDRQRELMEKYAEIEGLPQPPVSLQDVNGQRILRDFAWRTTEELCESFEQLEPMATGHPQDRFKEMADALHFLVELAIFSGIPWQRVVSDVEWDPSPNTGTSIASYYWSSVYDIGIAINMLKNKAWKKTPVPTDPAIFKHRVVKAFQSHFGVWACLGADLNDIHRYYFGKAKINQERQEEGY